MWRVVVREGCDTGIRNNHAADGNAQGSWER
jgi:hypothetical protein